ncbi:M23 family peptidase, partial [Micromonospora sp. NPDC049799]
MSPPPRGSVAALCALGICLLAMVGPAPAPLSRSFLVADPAAVPQPVTRLAPPAPGGATVPVPGAGASVPSAFRWPLDGPPDPVRRFDPPLRPWLPGHRGV